MVDFNKMEVWFLTGSQYLYGEETLKQVEKNSIAICNGLNSDDNIPVKIRFKTVLTTPESIDKICIEANSTANCVGLIAWCHTFSPAKMWIHGLKTLQKPMLHLHTQYNRDIPWKNIDMDFMNLNQSAHGDREFGYIAARLRMKRKVVVGHWEEEDVRKRIGVWTRVAIAWADWQTLKVARFGDNMREVAVTEGNKVSAQIKMGYSVYGYGVGDLVASVNKVSDKDVDLLVKAYRDIYNFSSSSAQDEAKLKGQAKIEIGLRTFLEEGNFNAFTTTFEDLHGLPQLPGLAVQRLMVDGYGFGAEGDWKTAALVRAVKVMGEGLPGGASFMEDYTYHLDPKGMKVLGAHMLEVCPSIAATKPSLEVHPLGIGGKDDPARLVFNVNEGPGINASLMDMGTRFRLLVNPCKVESPKEALPNLPVARVLWTPMPDLKTSAHAWILAGGAHHTAFSMAIDKEYLEDFAEIAGFEYLLIDEGITIADFKKEIHFNDLYYHLAQGII